MNKKIQFLRKPIFLVVLVIAIGVALRTVQYVGSSSMWLDELASAKNIETRNYYHLATQSLDFNQVAPIGFLFTQKLFISLFGTSDLAHRFLPWLGSVLAIFLFWQISRQFLSGIYLLTSLLFFAVCVSLIWLGSNEKHYSEEMAAVLFLTWAGISFSGNKKQGWCFWVGIVGALSCLMSFPAAVLAIGIVILLFFQRRNELRTARSSFFLMSFLWLLGAGLNLLYAKLVIADRQVFTNMHGYWMDGFPPSLNPFKLLPWIVNSTIQLISALLFLRPPPPLFVISLITFLCSLPAFVYIVKQKKFNATILILPYLVGIGLAVFDFYPWRHRVGLYSIWPFLIFFSMGLFAMGEWVKRRAFNNFTRSFAFAIPAIVLLLVIFVGKPPIIVQPSEPVLKELKVAMQQGDIIYVYSKGGYAIERYGPRVGINNWVMGHHYLVASEYKNDLQNLKGKSRVWFFYTQWTEKEPFPDSIRVYFGEMGKQLNVISKPKGAGGQEVTAAYLYDLSVMK